MLIYPGSNPSMGREDALLWGKLWWINRIFWGLFTEQTTAPPGNPSLQRTHFWWLWSLSKLFVNYCGECERVGICVCVHAVTVWWLVLEDQLGLIMSDAHTCIWWSTSHSCSPFVLASLINIQLRRTLSLFPSLALSHTHIHTLFHQSSHSRVEWRMFHNCLWTPSVSWSPRFCLLFVFSCSRIRADKILYDVYTPHHH